MMSGEVRRGSYRDLYPFRARELTVGNTDEQLIGYLGGRPTRMQ